MRTTVVTVLLVAGIVGGGAAFQRVEIDRTLQRVHGTAIMSSDVRQARMLRLLPDAGASDAAILTALENRLLMLYEVSRGTPREPTAEAIASRRAAWRSSWPAGVDLAALMTSAAMSEQALDGWFRNDLRIADYLEQRFGSRPTPERAKALVEWLATLRTRANLTGRRP